MWSNLDRIRQSHAGTRPKPTWASRTQSGVGRSQAKRGRGQTASARSKPAGRDFVEANPKLGCLRPSSGPKLPPPARDASNKTRPGSTHFSPRKMSVGGRQGMAQEEASMPEWVLKVRMPLGLDGQLHGGLTDGWRQTRGSTTLGLGSTGCGLRSSHVWPAVGCLWAGFDQVCVCVCTIRQVWAGSGRHPKRSKVETQADNLMRPSAHCLASHVRPTLGAGRAPLMRRSGPTRARSASLVRRLCTAQAPLGDQDKPRRLFSAVFLPGAGGGKLKEGLWGLSCPTPEAALWAGHR